MSKKTPKNLRTRSMLGLTSTVIGASAIYLAASNNISASADSAGSISSIPISLVTYLVGAFLLVLGAMILLFVFASK